ncbi:hypothetical protein AB1388_43540, partial [Streptomyces hydrogenans]
PVAGAAPLVRLPRLTRAGARALLDGTSGGGTCPAVAERLLDEAAGHPGVLAEAVRRLPPEMLDGTVPAPGRLVDDGVLARVYAGLLGALPADGRRLLRVVAAVCAPAAGAPYRTEVGTALARARAQRVPVEALDGLVAAGLLDRRGDALAFTDPFLARAAGAAPPAGRPSCDAGRPVR